MLTGLKIIPALLVRPNSAFTEIRDNYHTYLLWALGIYAISSLFDILSSVLTSHHTNTPINFAINLPILTIATFFIAYAMGRFWGGNKSLRRAFTVISYSYPIATLLILPLIAILMVSLDFFMLLNYDHIGTAVALVIAIAVAFVAVLIYTLIITFKAIRVLNEFSWEKTLVVWLVCIFVPGILFYVFNYLWILRDLYS